MGLWGYIGGGGRRWWCTVLMVLVVLQAVQCCGPGRGGSRRRPARRLRPLVFKQHVPNVSERTLGASGINEGPISRYDARFQDLVPNYNSDIIFKDEEGTGADRLMTERCKEKLNTLAISVMNQWPGVKVRVIEGWDEGMNHAPNSLHYEGRAVDITTSDKDRSKYGMLARLAREAGFDWVYYESRSHIHCSVKSESSAASKLGGCFPGRGRVVTPDGATAVGSLQVGDLIQVMRPDGSLAFSPVIMFLHRDPSTVRSFLKFTTSGGTSLTVTPSHLVFVLEREAAISTKLNVQGALTQNGVGLKQKAARLPKLSAKEALSQSYLMIEQEAANSTKLNVQQALSQGGVVLAARVQEGDYLLVSGPSGGVVLEKVISVEEGVGAGVFAPLTSEGTVVVDGVVASCYAVIDSQALAHWSFLPVRLFNNLRQAVLTLLRALSFIPSQQGTTYTHPLHRNVTWSSQKESVEMEGTDNSISVEADTVHIHWYPRMLYTLASWLLPRHLVYS